MELMQKKLHELYIKEEMSIQNIADYLGMSYSGARYQLIKYGIPLRKDKDAMKTKRNRELRSQNATGSNNSQWKGGRRIASHGYIEIYMPEHPHASSRGTVYEHRLVMERMIGRYLTSEESVHHVDEDKSNNAPDNLMLFENEAAHQRHHQEIKKKFAACKKSGELTGNRNVKTTAISSQASQG